MQTEKIFGKLVIFSAPSGSGKTSIVRNLLEKYPSQFGFSVSATTRNKRPHETDGVDYYFLSEEKFKERIENNDFVEYEEVYSGHYYGTLKKELERIWSHGRVVLFDIDVVGGLNLKNTYKADALAIYVDVPSSSDLKERLRKRSTESDEQINARLKKAETESLRKTEFDQILLNDNLQNATEKAYQTIQDFLKGDIS